MLKIEITDYGKDFGCGRVVASVDDCHPDHDLQEKGFRSLKSALEWVAEVTTEDEPDAEAQLEARNRPTYREKAIEERGVERI